MSQKYIRKNKNSYSIYKNSKNYGKFSNLQDAIIARDLLINQDWDLTYFKNKLVKFENYYLLFAVYDDKLYFLNKYKNKPDQITIDKSLKKHSRNPNNSRYGLNITKVFDTFVIKKQIAGDEYIFGYYDNLQDCEFVRNFLMDNNWNVNEFQEVEFDEDNDLYYVIRIIDDKVYVIDTSKSKPDLNKSYEKFLTDISKHKYGFVNYPHLDDLKNNIADLEEELNVKVSDKEWGFSKIKDTSDVLSDLIFNLTPFQKVIYDSIDGEVTIEDIKKSCIRFHSKNFDEKINKNLEELLKLNLIYKNENSYKKINV